MAAIYSIGRNLFALGLCIFLASGCASVRDTAIFYLPMTEQVFPPKAPDAPVPILGKAPSRRHEVIGRLAFASNRGWPFMRESILYNARTNGADAVILRDATESRELSTGFVPPRTDWIPVPGPVYETKKGKYYQGTSWIPLFRPGYTYPVVLTRTAVDAEMIVFQ